MFIQEMLARTGVMRWLPLLCIIVLLLQGCGIPTSQEEANDTAEAKYLDLTLGRLAARDYAAIEGAFDPRVDRTGMRQALEQVHALLPKEAPLKREPNYWNFQKKMNGAEGARYRVANVAIQYTYPSSRWVLVTASLSGEPGSFRLTGFHVQPLSASLSDINAFTLQGKGPVHYLVLLGELASIGIALLAFVACLRAKGLKRKWLWAFCTLLTVSSFTLNWTSGETAFKMLHAGFLGWGVLRAGWMGPWMITIPFPLGALVVLWRLGRHQAPDESAVAAGAPA